MPWKIVVVAGILLAAAAGLLVFTMRDGSEASQQIALTPAAENGVAGPFFAVPEGTPAAPADAFLDASGAEVSLATFKGKPVVLNFWATWCAPCVKELPSLERLKAARPDLTVIVLNVDTRAEGPIADFLKEVGASGLEAYTDPKKKLWRAFRLNSLPTTFVIDAEGRVVGRRDRDAEWDAPEAIAGIDAVLRD